MERRIIDSFDTAIEAKLTPFTQMQLAIIDLVRETIAQNIGSAMTSAMGIDVIDLSAKLSTIPNEMQQAFQRIRDQREHTRSISQELSDAEIVCKLANGVEGKNAEERGTLFVGAGIEVYEGMVIGETQRSGDIAVNICKKKHLTNMRSSNKDIEIRLTPPRIMSLDEAIEYLAEDELLEVTPLNYRIRKKILDTEERGKQTKKAKEGLLE